MEVELDDIRCIKESAITIRGSRRRITVPSEIVEILNLKHSDKLRWIIYIDGTIYLHAAKK